MKDWLSMDTAPIGRMETTVVEVNRKQVTKEVFVPERIITASKCGKIIVTYRLQDGRWNMYATDELPLAWMPLPKHPNESEVTK